MSPQGGFTSSSGSHWLLKAMGLLPVLALHHRATTLMGSSTSPAVFPKAMWKSALSSLIQTLPLGYPIGKWMDPCSCASFGTVQSFYRTLCLSLCVPQRNSVLCIFDFFCMVKLHLSNPTAQGLLGLLPDKDSNKAICRGWAEC